MEIVWLMKYKMPDLVIATQNLKSVKVILVSVVEQ